MAGETERHRARCTAILARCQALREQAAQLALTRARSAHDEVERRRADAAEAASTASRARKEGMRLRYEALVGNAAGEGELRAVRDTGARLVAECNRAAVTLDQAETKARGAAEAVRAAAWALTAEVQRGRKRTGMADAARARCSAMLATMEDTAMDDDTSDRAAAFHVRA